VDDPELLYDESRALYSIGRVAEAETTLRNALGLAETNAAAPMNEQLNKQFIHAEQAKRILEMIELANNPVLSAIDRVEQSLQAEPDNVPALMALGAIDEQRTDVAAAGVAYKKALKRFPDFSPAKLRLAILGAAKTDFDENAYDLAQQVRPTYPNDPDLAKALGLLLYRKGGEPSRAVNLLKQSAATRTNDPELFYYLGMAQLQSKDLAGSRQSLQKSLAIGLKPPLSAEAGKVLSGLK